LNQFSDVSFIDHYVGNPRAAMPPSPSVFGLIGEVLALDAE
jgi:hypothetical protein